MKSVKELLFAILQPQNTSLCAYGRLLMDGELTVKRDNLAVKTRLVDEVENTWYEYWTHIELCSPCSAVFNSYS